MRGADPNPRGSAVAPAAGRSGPTSVDVARLAGVSQSTVSRALRDDSRVASDTCLRVKEVADRLHYLPNSAARNLITRRTKAIGVVVSDITNPFYPQLVDVLHDEFSLCGYRMLLLNERVDGSSSRALEAQLQGRSVDGIAFASATLSSTFIANFPRQGIPVVLINRDVDGVELDRVVSDNLDGGRQAGQMLTELGHRRIAIIAGPANTSTARDRECGFRESLSAAGLELDRRLSRAGDYSHHSGYQWCLELLREEPAPTAIACANDVVAFGALDAARRLGVRVPEDLSVVGYDDVEMASWEAFNLTTVHQPLARMARVAARLLIGRLEHAPESSPQAHVFPARVVKRQTTGPVPR